MRTLVGTHLRGPFRFKGRETRQSFWPWAALAMGIAMIVWTLALIAILAMATRAGGPADIFQRSGQVMMIIACGTILLLAAAVTRRLHDSGRRGWWALPVPLLLLTGLYVMSLTDAGMRAKEGDPFSGWFGAAMGVNLLYLVSLAWLVLLCVRRGQFGENRYGDQP